MSIRYAAIATVIIVLTLVASCGTAEPTGTPVPPTDTPVPDGLTIDVPRGNPPTLDGTLSSDEWSGAQKTELAGGGELLLVHDGSYLYLGIRAKANGVGSICVAQGDEIAILHASMALGTAIYKKVEEGWRRTRNFSWSCRDTIDSPQAQAERIEHLQKDHWLANNMGMGTPEEMEFQIAIPEGSLRLAVTYLEISGLGSDSVVWWPANLDDSCRNRHLIEGRAPGMLRFSPEKWITVTASTITKGGEGAQPTLATTTCPPKPAVCQRRSRQTPNFPTAAGADSIRTTCRSADYASYVGDNGFRLVRTG